MLGGLSYSLIVEQLWFSSCKINSEVGDYNFKTVIPDVLILVVNLKINKISSGVIRNRTNFKT